MAALKEEVREKEDTLFDQIAELADVSGAGLLLWPAGYVSATAGPLAHDD